MGGPIGAKIGNGSPIDAYSEINNWVIWYNDIGGRGKFRRPTRSPFFFVNGFLKQYFRKWWQLKR
jgi:hypothetical protein